MTPAQYGDVIAIPREMPVREAFAEGVRLSLKSFLETMESIGVDPKIAFSQAEFFYVPATETGPNHADPLSLEDASRVRAHDCQLFAWKVLLYFESDPPAGAIVEGTRHAPVSC